MWCTNNKSFKLNTSQVLFDELQRTMHTFRNVIKVNSFTINQQTKLYEGLDGGGLDCLFSPIFQIIYYSVSLIDVF